MGGHWKVPIFLLAGFALCMGGMLLIWEAHANILEDHRTCHNNVDFLQNPGNRQSEVRKQAIWDLALHGAGAKKCSKHIRVFHKEYRSPPGENLCKKMNKMEMARGPP